MRKVAAYAYKKLQLMVLIFRGTRVKDDCSLWVNAYPGDDAVMEVPSKRIEPIAVAVEVDQGKEIARERMIG